MNPSAQEVAPLARTLARDWRAFGDRLAAAPATLEEDRNLLLSAEHWQRFVQFTGSGASGLKAESVRSAYLAEADQLLADQVVALIAAGWRSPTHAAEASNAEKDCAESRP